MHPIDLCDESDIPNDEHEARRPRPVRSPYRNGLPLPARLAEAGANPRQYPASRAGSPPAPDTRPSLGAPRTALIVPPTRPDSRGTGTLNRWLGFSLAVSALTVVLFLALFGSTWTNALASGGPQDPPSDNVPPVPTAPAPTAPTPRPEEVIREAEGAEKAVSQREADLVKSLKDLDLILAQWAPGDLRQEGRALGQSKKVVQQLRAFADSLIKGHAEANKHFQLYRGALDRAPEKLTASTAVYERYAAGETLDFFKEQYLDMAAKAKVIAIRFTARGQELAKVERDLTAKMEFVQKSRVFLDRMDGFIDLMACGQGNGAEVQQYLGQLTRYMAQLETSIRGFRTITDKIATPPAQP